MNNKFGCQLCKNTNYPMMHDCSSQNKIIDIDNIYKNMIKISDMNNIIKKFNKEKHE